MKAYSVFFQNPKTELKNFVSIKVYGNQSLQIVHKFPTFTYKILTFAKFR